MQTEAFQVTPDMLASSSQRVTNYFVDLIIQYAILFGFALVLVIIGNLFELYAIAQFIGSFDAWDEYLAGMVMVIMYYGITETLLGRSFAKYLTKTVVVYHDGTKPDATAIMKRTFSRLIPFDALSYLNDDTRGWHDRISATYVVKKEVLDEMLLLHRSFDEIGKTTV